MSSTIYGLLNLIATTAGYTIQAVAQGANTLAGASINITSGTGGTQSPGGEAGAINITAAEGTFSNQGGIVNITGGAAGPTGFGGGVNITGGAGSTEAGSDGGTITLTSGTPQGFNSRSGQIIIQPGLHTGNAIPALMRWNGSIYTTTAGGLPAARVERFATNLCNPNIVLDASHNILTWTLYADDMLDTYAAATVYYSIMIQDSNASPVLSQIANGQVNFTTIMDPTLSVVSSVSKLYELNSSSNGSGTLSTTWAISSVINSDPSTCYLSVIPSSTTITTPTYFVIFFTLMSNSLIHFEEISS